MLDLGKASTETKSQIPQPVPFDGLQVGQQKYRTA